MLSKTLGESAFEQSHGSLTISVSPDGKVKKVTGAEELLSRRNRLLTSKIARGKRHGTTISDGTYGKTEK
jgi:hypothetical protein